MLVFALVAAARSIQLDRRGVPGEAEVVAVNFGSRADFVRVRLDSRRQVELWAWSGRPEVGTTIDVVSLPDGSRVKQAGTFLPDTFWGSLAAAAGFAGAAVAMVFVRRRKSG